MDRGTEALPKLLASVSGGVEKSAVAVRVRSCVEAVIGSEKLVSHAPVGFVAREVVRVSVNMHNRIILSPAG